ncbi:MAG: hypothetical protein AAFZ65_01260 [Planctomycetota bacterium]
MFRTAFASCLAATVLPGAASGQECFGKVYDNPVGARSVLDVDGVIYTPGSMGGELRIAERSQGEWSVLPGVFDGDVLALASTSLGLVAGGEFTTVDGVATGGIARFDGTHWLPIGGGVTGAGAAVHAIAEFGGDLYAGGSFPGAGAVNSPNIARWDGSAWVPVGTGLDGIVNDLAVFEGALVVAGEFVDAGGLGLASVVNWDGLQFSPIAPTALVAVDDLDVTDSRLAVVAGGRLSVLFEGDWVQPGNQPLDVFALDVAFHDGGIVVAGSWSTFCKPFGGSSCLIRSRFLGGTWSTIATDDQFPDLDRLSLASSEEGLWETGSSDGFLKLADAPAVLFWTPSTFSWYAEPTLRVTLGCAAPGVPVTVAIDGGAPLATVQDGSGYEVVLTPAALQATGSASLLVAQGEFEVEIPAAVNIWPRLTVTVDTLFQNTAFLRVQADADDGVAGFYVSSNVLESALPIDGVFSPVWLDPAGLIFLGANALDPFTQQFNPLQIALPPTLPPGLVIPAQAVVAEVVDGGLLVAVTQLENVDFD